MPTPKTSRRPRWCACSSARHSCRLSTPSKWYVLRVVRNLATDQARARSRVSVEPWPQLPESTSGEGHPEERVLRAVEEALSRVALANLSACHQEVLTLRFLDGLGYPALARRL